MKNMLNSMLKVLVIALCVTALGIFIEKGNSQELVDGDHNGSEFTAEYCKANTSAGDASGDAAEARLGTDLSTQLKSLTEENELLTAKVKALERIVSSLVKAQIEIRTSTFASDNANKTELKSLQAKIDHLEEKLVTLSHNALTNSPKD